MRVMGEKKTGSYHLRNKTDSNAQRWLKKTLHTAALRKPIGCIWHEGAVQTGINFFHGPPSIWLFLVFAENHFQIVISSLHMYFVHVLHNSVCEHKQKSSKSSHFYTPCATGGGGGTLYVTIEVVTRDVWMDTEISIPPITDLNSLKSIFKSKYRRVILFMV